MKIKLGLYERARIPLYEEGPFLFLGDKTMTTLTMPKPVPALYGECYGCWFMNKQYCIHRNYYCKQCDKYFKWEDETEPISPENLIETTPIGMNIGYCHDCADKEPVVCVLCHDAWCTDEDIKCAENSGEEPVCVDCGYRLYK